MNELATHVESTVCHEYMEMRVEAHFIGKVRHNNSARSQSPASVLVGARVVDCCFSPASMREQTVVETF